MKVRIAGVLNITPDSFSDGGRYFSPETALSRAREMLSKGADLIDIGGDSTRPGSNCVGEDEELRRILPVVEELSSEAQISVDTHHAAVADAALKAGAKIINDISGGGDPEMFKTAASLGGKIIIMYSRCPKPHDFSLEPQGDIIQNCKAFFFSKLEIARRAGLRDDSIILDPGMGAFISANPDRSFELISRISELREFGLPIMLGISRKGFLKRPGEETPADRDLLSAELAAQAVSRLSGVGEVYIRAHNAAIHSRIFL